MIENTFGMNIIPVNDIQRLQALKRYRIMDSPSEDSFDHIAKLCTQIFNVPISLVSLVDAEKVFFKANVGMGNAKEANRGKSLCALAVLNEEVTVFEDALKEPCLLANPNVIGDFGLRFYAGAPLITHDGFLIGTLCIIDKKTRTFTKEEETILAGMAKAVMDHIELRIAALDEIHEHKLVSEQVLEQQEELKAINEELITTNEEMLMAKEYLGNLNDELVISDSRFKSLIKDSPVAIAILNGRDLVIESANDAILAIWGKDESVIGTPLAIALPELKGQPFLGLLDDVYTSNKTYYGKEAKLLMKQDGQLKDIYVNFTYQILDINAERKDILVNATDVTEQVVARFELQEINQRLEIALDASKLGATEVDLATGIMQSSEQFKANYGFGKDEEFNYPDLFNAMLPEHRERIKGLVKIAIDNNSVYQAEYPVKWRDGSIHWISAHGRPRYHENGKVRAMVGMSADITKNKLFEQRKDEFLSVASHELKTPITSLKASLQLLDRIKEKPTSPSHIKLIEQATRSMEKMSLLVDDLLNVNRITEGQLQLDKSIFNIADMLNVSCNHVRMEGKYVLELEGDLNLMVEADQHRIDQVVVNFVNNAVKYAPESKEIRLLVEKVNGFAKISVIDKGNGIESRLLPNLFDRYYRVNHDGKNYSGLGLGLYICAEIVKRHDGEIGATSEIGKGSTFYFTLPLYTN